MDAGGAGSRSAGRVRAKTENRMRIDIGGLTQDTRTMSHDAILRHVEALEALGYRGVWFNEFHFQPDIPHPSTLLLASAVLARTERIRFGTSIVVLPLYHPFLLAEMIAQLCHQSGHRLDLGVGRGTNPATLRALGIDPDATGEAFALSLRLMRKVWKESVEMPGGSIWPQGSGAVGPLLAGDEPQLYVAGRSEETCLLAAAEGLPLMLSSNFPPQEVLDTYRENLADPSAIARTSHSRFVCIAPTQSQAMEDVDALMETLHEEALDFARKRGRPTEEMAGETRESFLRNRAIAGTPEACIAQIQALEAELGFGELRVVFSDARQGEIGASPATVLFAREVLPVFEG